MNLSLILDRSTRVCARARVRFNWPKNARNAIGQPVDHPEAGGFAESVK
jgi:hypothetical protein